MLLYVVTEIIEQSENELRVFQKYVDGVEYRALDVGGSGFTICPVHQIVIKSKKTMWNGICNRLLRIWQKFTHS
jgi:hypothetical protein